MKIIDTFEQIEAMCASGMFDEAKWTNYIRALSPTVERLNREDMQECLSTGKFTFENDYLPVLNAACADGAARKKAHESFLRCAEGLEEKVIRAFGRCPDIDIYFYFGLCGGAGWVTEVDGRLSVLLGLEKIVELDWTGLDNMNGLLIHELGHCYQAVFGVLERGGDCPRKEYLWQLFIEGIAMYFEQRICGGSEYFHQYTVEWKDWCDSHLETIKADFESELDDMSLATQRYFGDWASYEGHGDVGYYLGCRLIQFAMKSHSFDELITWDIPDVEKLWKDFLKA